MQLGGSSVSEISPPSKPEMAVTAAAAPAPQEEAAREGVNGGHEVVGMEVDANSSGEEKGRELGEGGGGGDDHEGDKISFGGNRWPRQETLALLKIRSDMDAVFRDSSLKGPLWEEVSRILAELGYHRSAKKCKEKFENVYKYHKRTKESRSGKSEGKTYKFFDQLQALENQFVVSYQPKPQPVLATTTTTTTNTVAFPITRPSDSTTISHATTTFPSTNTIISSSAPPTNNATTTTATTTTTTVTNTRNPPSQPNNISVVPHSLPSDNNNSNMNLIFSPSPTSTSSSTASDEGLEERYRKKRKWKDYFRRLTRQVLAKQEEMQKWFLEAIDKKERERMAQEDAWRMQELARINKEHEILVQERSNAAAKDAAVIALLHKLSGQQNPPQPAAPPQLLPPQVVPPQQQQQKAQQELSQPQPQPPPPLMPNNNFEIQGIMNNGHSGVVTTTPMSSSATSSSRWPKAEVHALIRLRTSLEAKYQENGPKAPLWEDISAGMERLGYNRNAKRCKEKWENINKYFKKVKESSKQRREDSKTCPYFNELDAIYKERSKNQNPFGNVKPSEMMMEPLMVQPEQQWRPPPQYHHEQQPLQDQDGVANENATSQSQEKEAQAQAEEAELEEEEDDEYVDDEDGDTSVEDESASRYEIVTNKLSSVDTVE